MPAGLLARPGCSAVHRRHPLPRPREEVPTFNPERCWGQNQGWCPEPSPSPTQPSFRWGPLGWVTVPFLQKENRLQPATLLHPHPLSINLLNLT